MSYTIESPLREDSIVINKRALRLQDSYHGAYGIRTRDLHTASVARSQLR